MRSYLTALIAGVTLSGLLPQSARAEYPIVGFDVGWVVTCHEVTPKAGAKPASKIIEAVFRLSPEIKRGEEADLKRIRYEIYSADAETPVKSFAPGSIVSTDVVDGAVEIESKQEDEEVLLHYVIAPAEGSGRLRANRKVSHLRFKMLAPKKLLQATGTTKRGSGVFFELHPSSKETLQRQREFAILFEVPQTWRAEYVIRERIAPFG